MDYYKRHVFFCLNKRDDGNICCSNHDAETMFEYTKNQVKSLGQHSKGNMRINRAGCLGRCSEGPVLVVYPEAVWYTYVDKEDIDEIVASHLQQGKVVERLKI